MMLKKINHILMVSILLLTVPVFADEFDLHKSELLRPLKPLSGKLLAGTIRPDSRTLDMSELTGKPESISMKKALVLSFLLPGAGEYYAGARFKGQVFFGVEAAIWTGFIAHRVYGGWKKDDYKDYAAAYAGVDNTGKDEQFYDWVGFYDSREEFNQFGRLYFPDRAYLPDTETYDWQWGSDAQRERYKQIKDDSKRAFRNANFFLGLALINRVISGIDTYRTVKSAQKKLKSLSQFGDYKVKLKTKPWGSDPSFNLVVTRKF